MNKQRGRKTHGSPWFETERTSTQNIVTVNGKREEYVVTADRWVDTGQRDQAHDAHRLVRDAVGRNRRILLIGYAVGPLARILADEGCSLVAVERDGVLAANDVPFCERVLTADPEEVELERALAGERFDVVVLPDLEAFREPAAILRSATPLLASGGRIVASMLNAAHVDVRLRLLQGQLPFGTEVHAEQSIVPLYFRDSIATLFDEAGLDIVQLDRSVRETEDGRAGVAGLPPTVIDALMADAEALTDRFVVVARPQAMPELDLIELRLRRLTGMRDEITRALDGLTTTLATQAEQLSGLSAAILAIAERDTAIQERIGHLAGQTEGLGAAMRAIQDEDIRQAEELSAVSEHLESRHQLAIRHPQAPLSPIDLEQIRYQRIIHGLRGALKAAAHESAALVISRGDDELLRVDGVQCQHFPQDAHGVYAGYYPGGSAEVIAHLEELRVRCADFLAIPATSLWWLDHYTEFGRHLLEHYRVVYRDETIGMIFAAARPAEGRTTNAGAR